MQLAAIIDNIKTKLKLLFNMLAIDVIGIASTPFPLVRGATKNSVFF